MKVAAQFDELNEKQKRTFYAMWMAYVQASATDAEVEAKMPVTQNGPYTGPERRKSKT